MKTYTRRKQAHRLIENVHEYCRLCLQKTKDMETVALFTSESEKLCPSLTMKIMTCLGLEIANEECLPNLICSECFEKLNNYYAYRKKCGIAYQTLKSHSLAVKEIQLKNDATTKAQDLNCNGHSSNANYNNFEADKIVFSLPLNEDQHKNHNNWNEVEVANTNNHLVNGIPPQDDSTVPDLSEFLKSILLELGIIEKKDENYLQSYFIDNTIELETGDGFEITLQLLESNEEVNSVGDQGIISGPDLNNTLLSVVNGGQDKVQDGRPVCFVCDKKFVSRGVLRRHLRVHTGERPFACRICMRRFAQREVLRRHELVHQENRPYPCNICSKSFTQRASLAAHMRTHVPPSARSLALHQCAVCPKIFLHASGLSRHMKEHNGNTMWCNKCTRQFHDRSSLLRHQRRTHGSSSPQTQTQT